MDEPKFGYLDGQPALTPPSTTDAAMGYINPTTGPRPLGWPTAPKPGSHPGLPPGMSPGMGGIGSLAQLLATRDMIDQMLAGMGYTKPVTDLPAMVPTQLAQQMLGANYSPGVAAPGGTGKVHFTGGLTHPNPALTDPTGPRLSLIANILTALGNLRGTGKE